MKLAEFVATYCQDIMAKVEEMKEAGFDDNSYDDLIKDEDTGQLVKVIYVGTIPVKVDDIFYMAEDSFSLEYPDPECLEAREQYLRPYTIVTGLEVLTELEKMMSQEMENMKRNYALQKELEDDNSKPDEEGSEAARQLYSGGW